MNDMARIKEILRSKFSDDEVAAILKGKYALTRSKLSKLYD
jgi:transcription initiation factor IIE alpha subunit